MELKLIFALIAVALTGASAQNARPIIGVLSQGLTSSEAAYAPEGSNSYIAASYIKFVEAGGARAVPVVAGRSDEYYQSLFNQINGLLLPGGEASLTSLNASTYISAANTLYQLAVEANDAGDYFPIWGTCLGFELMPILTAGGDYVLTSCSAENIALPINPTANFNSSRLYSALPADVYDYLLHYNSTVNYHSHCVTTQAVSSSNVLESRFIVLSLDNDINGLEFISSYEDVSRPFYGTQWHPEKPMFEWNVNNTATPHNWEGVRAGQHLANFLVQEARKSAHKFDTQENEDASLIYNYQPVDTAQYGGYFDQIYYFD